MPVVSETVLRADLTPVRRARVTIRTYPGPAYHASGSVVDEVRTETDDDGLWSATLPACETLTPTGTVYLVTVYPTGTTRWRRHIDVPNTAGPFDPENILTEEPEAIGGQISASNVLVEDVDDLFATSTVESVLAELGAGGGGGGMTAAAILAALLTVDGSGSGLDADLLDGQSSAAFLTTAAAAAGYQPLDSDLTAIAALTTTAYGRAFLALANQAALIALLPSYQPLDTDLTTLAGLTATTDNFLQSKASAWASRTPAQVATDLGAAGLVANTLFDAHTIIYATTDNTPVALTVGASTFVGRKASGNISAMSATEAAALLTALVAKATYPWSVTVALSDMTTQITTGATKAYWVNPFDTTITVTKVKATLATAGSGSTVVDVNEGAGAGTTILSTKITIDASETDSDDATGAVISDTTIAADGRITFDIDTAGTSAAGLQVTLIGTRVLA